MDNHTITRFFNQLIKEVKKDTKNIGIITDKDGTLFLDDSLEKALKNFNEKNLGTNIYIIANSGRTVQDMINCLEQENIPIGYFDYIIGDNGGMCLDVKRNKQLYKHIMDNKVVLEVIDKFLEIGGKISDVRIADGENIFAYPSEEVKEYYQNRKGIIYKDNIKDLADIDITKLTLAGPHGKINKINSFIRENMKGYKTHIGKTSFPNKKSNNYRIDFTRNAYKRRSF